MSLEVVVVSHGQPDLLRACLRSLEAHPPSVQMRVTVVDSGSPDHTPDIIAREFPWVRLVREDNIGFSAANNLVLGATRADAALLLNPDAEVREGTIDTALATLASSDDIGMVGVKLLQPSGEIDHACKRSFPTPLSALAHFTGLGRSEGAPAPLSQYRATHLDENESGDVDAVNGAFMLVRMDAVRQVGLLDEGYWLYMEDLDWCARFWQQGWRVRYEPAGTAIHVKGASSGSRRRLRAEVAFHRGMGRFYRRFQAPQKPAALNAMVYLGIGVKLAVTLAITAAHRARAALQD